MPGLSKRQIQSRAAGKTGGKVMSDKKIMMDTAAQLSSVSEQLTLALKRIEDLESELITKQKKIVSLEGRILKLCDEKTSLSNTVQQLKHKHKQTYHRFRMAEQAHARSLTKQDTLKAQADLLRAAAKGSEAKLQDQSKEADRAISVLTSLNNSLRSELSTSLTKWKEQIDGVKSRLERSAAALRDSRKEVMRLTKSVKRAAGVKARSVASAKAKIAKELTYHHLMHKGVFTEKTRNVIRILVKAGCSAQYVNEVIFAVLRSAGIQPVGNISRTSVRRIVREGYIAAQIQLGFEMKMAEGMTFSADGTGHRSINYNSRHVHLVAEDYRNSTHPASPLDSVATDASTTASNPSPVSSQASHTHRVTRFFGIQPSRDNSSSEAILDWKSTITNILDVYNRSPFGKRSGNLFKLIDVLIKLTGMNSDHCAKEKKDARKMEELKRWAIDQHLGEEALLEKTVSEVDSLYHTAEKAMIKKAGGSVKWAALSVDDQAARHAKMVEDIVSKLGKEAYTKLSGPEQQALRLFIWAGCGCHKDLNTVRGGHRAMTQYWIDNNLEGPICLSNRDNDPVLQECADMLENGEEPTAAQERALARTTGGAIKLAEIAGALLNHKDDKKGHHDHFRWWWSDHVGTPFTFPDTSNNRFLSYCDAAGALILHRDRFIEFLIHVRDNKQSGTLNHMEANMWKGLHCDNTRSELAVLVLYAESVSYPYLRAIRAPGNSLNMLDLGPLHTKVGTHIAHIIQTPSLLINPPASQAKVATLSGEAWQNPDAIKCIHSLIPSLPHFRGLFLAFFEGASKTWTRFTTEFAPGGLIDEATAEEKELAWLPATNDENEGALGLFRHMMTRQPQLSLITHNALAMFFRNNTQDFMASKFTEDEDYQFIHKAAREMQGEDKKLQQDIIHFRDEKQKKKCAAKAKRQANAAKQQQVLSTTKLVRDEEIAGSLKGDALIIQTQLFKIRGAPNLQNIPKKADHKRAALVVAVNLLKSGEWIPAPPDSEGDSDTESEGSGDETDDEE